MNRAKVIVKYVKYDYETKSYSLTVLIENGEERHLVITEYDFRIELKEAGFEFVSNWLFTKLLKELPDKAVFLDIERFCIDCEKEDIEDVEIESDIGLHITEYGEIYLPPHLREM